MAEQALTVADLVATASLDTTVLAGTSGLDRTVLWAHSCEMTDPEHWLGPGELLMTVGLCVPTEAEEQQAFVERLDAAGLSGIMIGDHPPKPELSEAMLATAERLGFPMLLVGARTPYAAVARLVAAAASTRQTVQVLRLSKLYQVAATTDEPHRLIAELARALHVGLVVDDELTGLRMLGEDAPPALRGAERRSRLGTRRPTVLTVSEGPGSDVDSFLLVHLAHVLQSAVDRLDAATERRLERSNRTMVALLNGAGHAEAAELVAPHLASDGFRVIAVAPADAARLERACMIAGLPVILGAGRTHHLALTPLAAVPAVRALLAEADVRAGASSVFTDVSDARAAAREGVHARDAIRHGKQRWGEFEGVTVSVLSRSRREAHEIVIGVLGPLAEHDDRATMLRETLFSFLRNDRRWAPTADELRIHRQTLAYRLQRVQESTGLDLATTGDLASAWVAYQAWGKR